VVGKTGLGGSSTRHQKLGQGRRATQDKLGKDAKEKQGKEPGKVIANWKVKVGQDGGAMQGKEGKCGRVRKGKAE
jgi:hypothetical protein